MTKPVGRGTGLRILRTSRRNVDGKLTLTVTVKKAALKKQEARLRDADRFVEKTRTELARLEEIDLARQVAEFERAALADRLKAPIQTMSDSSLGKSL